MKIFDLISKINNFLSKIFNRLFLKIDFLFIKIGNFILELKIKKQKKLLINKIDEIKRKAILSNKQQKIENLIKKILDKNNLKEEVLKK